MQTEIEDCLGLIGKSISVPEATNLKCSLTVLTQQCGTPVRLWGKVEGYSTDYWVAQAASARGATDVANRSSWFSVDAGISWARLPRADEISEEQAQFCDQLRGPFMGNPAYEYKVQKELPQEEAAPVEVPSVEDAPDAVEEREAGEDEDEPKDDADQGETQEEGEEEKKPAVKKPKFRVLAMKESVRLGHFVVEHDRNCAIVPRAAFLMKDDSTVIPNRGFAGLTVTESKNIRNYFHCVAPSPTASRVVPNKELFGNEYNRYWDFLVSITADMPAGVWGAKYDALLNMAVVQNYLFAGSVFWLKPDTNKYGQLYWGKGERNLDLCFVLP